MKYAEPSGSSAKQVDLNIGYTTQTDVKRKRECSFMPVL
jgi:hypothetical protein